MKLCFEILQIVFFILVIIGVINGKTSVEVSIYYIIGILCNIRWIY